jgi:hypothetical protein
MSDYREPGDGPAEAPTPKSSWYLPYGSGRWSCLVCGALWPTLRVDATETAGVDWALRIKHYACGGEWVTAAATKVERPVVQFSTDGKTWKTKRMP